MWNELSMRHLLALRAVATEGTFGKAAARLGFTQSAVSQQVAALEQMVGQPLFDRPSGPRRPQLTAAGEVFLAHADELIERVEATEIEMQRFARGVAGHLSIGTFQSISARVLPQALRRLHETAPAVEVRIIEEDNDHDFRVSMLDRGEVDVAFVVGEAPEGYRSKYLGADPHVAVVPVDYPGGPVDLVSLSGQPMVGQPEGDTCGLLVDRGLERLGVSANYAFRSHDNTAIQGMVRAGMGVAVVPLLTVDASDPEVSIRTTEPELAPRNLSLIWSSQRTLSPVGERFVEVTAAVCEELLARAPLTAAG